MFESLKTFGAVLIEHPLGWLVLGFGGLVLLQTAIGLARSRQWALLPLALGLTALAGILDQSAGRCDDVAPVARYVEQPRGADVVGHRPDDPGCNGAGDQLAIVRQVDRGLVVVVAGIDPLAARAGLIVAMLFWEHAWLARFVGARPEVVGRNVGLGAALLLAVCTFAAMAVAARKLALVHCLVSGTVVLACMFVPLLPLPLPGMQLACSRWTRPVAYHLDRHRGVGRRRFPLGIPLRSADDPQPGKPAFFTARRRELKVSCHESADQCLLPDFHRPADPGDACAADQSGPGTLDVGAVAAGVLVRSRHAGSLDAYSQALMHNTRPLPDLSPAAVKGLAEGNPRQVPRRPCCLIR
jgi:hypothetical protein